MPTLSLTPRTARSVAAGALVVGLAVALTACGSSGGSAKTASTTPAQSTPATSTSAAPTTTAPVSTTASSAPIATGGTPADAATTAAVTKAYTTFFGGTKDPAALAADLQNGTKLAAALAEEAKNPTAATLTATVSKVVLANPHVADVTFTLLSKGAPLLANTSGKAVLVGGTWQLAATTFGGLVAATGTTPPVCEQPAITALPTS